MKDALADLEKFLHDREDSPALIHCAVAHAQFETIHPFLDGNGRVGRLLITFLLCERSILQQPLLYISYYLKAHRSQYYDRLMAIRNDGDWEGWIKFFLRGVLEVSNRATDTARSIVALREDIRSRMGKVSGSNNGLRLLEHLFESPVVSTRAVEKLLEIAYLTAAHLIEDFVGLGVLKEITGKQRGRLYRFDPYLELFDKQSLVG
jgi:Fic family protein